MTERLGIGEFARQVGITPSALRFYDDCGILHPAEVDDGNGYRYYSADQQERAELLRDLREIDLPLEDVRVVLDASPSEARELVEAHLRLMTGRAAAVRRAGERVLDALGTESGWAVGGAEFASAIRQVVSAAATSSDLPGLLGVLLEFAPDVVKLVTTDRYRLAVRELHLTGGGATGRVLVPATALNELVHWSAGATEVRLMATAEALRVVRDGGDARELPTLHEEYPAYQDILDGLKPPVCRAVLDRVRLLAVLSDLSGSISVGLDAGQADVQGVTLAGAGTGAARVGFTAELLAASVGASVGPDVLLEIFEPHRPVVVRSADQGTFTTLVMPARLDG